MHPWKFGPLIPEERKEDYESNVTFGAGKQKKTDFQEILEKGSRRTPRSVVFGGQQKKERLKKPFRQRYARHKRGERKWIERKSRKGERRIYGARAPWGKKKWENDQDHKKSVWRVRGSKCNKSRKRQVSYAVQKRQPSWGGIRKGRWKNISRKGKTPRAREAAGWKGLKILVPGVRGKKGKGDPIQTGEELRGEYSLSPKEGRRKEREGIRPFGRGGRFKGKGENLHLDERTRRERKGGLAWGVGGEKKDFRVPKVER